MISLIEIENETQWLNFRGSNGLGASEIATLLGYNPNQSAFELFYKKLGFIIRPFFNLRMAYGKCSEQLNSDLVEAYDVTNPENHAMNLQKGIKFRECKKLPQHAFIVNDEIPFLYTSPDREVIINARSGSLEAKDTSAMYVNAFLNKIPPMHEIQLRVQLWAWEKPFGIVSHILDGGRDYREHHFERNGFIFQDKYSGQSFSEEDVKQRIADFWQGVVLAREASHKMEVAKMNFNMAAVAEYQNIINQCEPDPDFSISFENYVKENYYSIARPVIETKGTAEDVVIAEDYLRAKEEADNKKKVYQLHKNKILSLCKSGNKIILPGNAAFIEVRDTKAGVKINVKV